MYAEMIMQRVLLFVSSVFTPYGQVDTSYAYVRIPEQACARRVAGHFDNKVAGK